MSDVNFFLDDLRNGFFIIWKRVISNGDAIQGITSCLALYFTYKLFVFTRKKPQINLEYLDGEWILKNVGDLGVSNVKIIFLDIRIAEARLSYNGYEEAKSKISKKREVLKGKQFNLFDVGIGQSIELNKLFSNGKIELGLSLFFDKSKMDHLPAYFDDKIEEDQYSQYLYSLDLAEKEIEDKMKEYKEEIYEMQQALKYFIKSISFLELKITGDGYNQTIKYMR